MYKALVITVIWFTTLLIILCVCVFFTILLFYQVYEITIQQRERETKSFQSNADDDGTEKQVCVGYRGQSNTETETYPDRWTGS